LQPKKWIPALHGLRGIAALSVLVGHSAGLTKLPINIAPSLGVALFFVLSGFLMGYLYIGERASLANIARYIIARFGRIYPLFAVVVIGAVAARILGYPEPFGLGLNNLLSHLALQGGALTVWTVAVECQFYALFVLMWIVYDRWTGSKLLALAVFSAVLMVVALYLTGYTGRIAIGRYLHVFVVGMFCALFMERLARFQRLASWVLPISFLAFVASMMIVPKVYDHELIYRDPTIWLICAALVLSAAIAGSSPFSRLLSTRPMAFLGEISFGIYLLHRPALLMIEHFGFLRGPWLLPLILLLTIAMAAVAHFVIERPARRFIRTAGDWVVTRVLSVRAASLQGTAL
jgi:peptidoglycan/LPS O-acetylase OafA/YrhL